MRPEEETKRRLAVSRTGVTLVEMVVVMVIIGSLAVLATRRMGASALDHRRQSEARRLINALRYVRELAYYQAPYARRLTPNCGYGIKFCSPLHYTPYVPGPIGVGRSTLCTPGPPLENCPLGPLNEVLFHGDPQGNVYSPIWIGVNGPLSLYAPNSDPAWRLTLTDSRLSRAAGYLAPAAIGIALTSDDEAAFNFQVYVPAGLPDDRILFRAPPFAPGINPIFPIRGGLLLNRIRVQEIDPATSTFTGSFRTDPGTGRRIPAYTRLRVDPYSGLVREMAWTEP